MISWFVGEQTGTDAHLHRDLDGRPRYNATSYNVLDFALRENAVISLPFIEEKRRHIEVKGH